MPFDDLYLDKKQFTWKLIVYDDSQIGFGVDFKNPKYISASGIDTMKITLKKASDFL